MEKIITHLTKHKILYAVLIYLVIGVIVASTVKDTVAQSIPWSRLLSDLPDTAEELFWVLIFRILLPVLFWPAVFIRY